MAPEESRPANLIGRFLEECAKELIIQNRGSRSPREALDRELERIATSLEAPDTSPSGKAVLLLLQDFYTRLKNEPADEALDQSWGVVVVQRAAFTHIPTIRRDVEAITSARQAA